MTIVGLAQNFVGSNNINVLDPNGQFGTRLQGGQDAASPRYIFTNVAAITRTIFHPADDALLDYLNDDGQSIEPSWYMPILPMVLVNGSDGIGTGASLMSEVEERAYAEAHRLVFVHAELQPGRHRQEPAAQDGRRGHRAHAPLVPRLHRSSLASVLVFDGAKRSRRDRSRRSAAASTSRSGSGI
jgi:hypothetical protein